jgi:hypothetical protein
MGLLNGAKDNNPQPPRAKIKSFNLQKQEQKPSTFKSKNKILQPSKEKKTPLTFLRTRTRTFNLLKNRNKNFQPPK